MGMTRGTPDFLVDIDGQGIGFLDKGGNVRVIPYWNETGNALVGADNNTVALGGGGGASVPVRNEGTQITAAMTSLNVVGDAVQATSDGSGNVTVAVDAMTAAEVAAELAAMVAGEHLDYVYRTRAVVPTTPGHFTVGEGEGTGGIHFKVTVGAGKQFADLTALNAFMSACTFDPGVLLVVSLFGTHVGTMDLEGATNLRIEGGNGSLQVSGTLQSVAGAGVSKTVVVNIPSANTVCEVGDYLIPVVDALSNPQHTFAGKVTAVSSSQVTFTANFDGAPAFTPGVSPVGYFRLRDRLQGSLLSSAANLSLYSVTVSAIFNYDLHGATTRVSMTRTGVENLALNGGLHVVESYINNPEVAFDSSIRNSFIAGSLNLMGGVLEVTNTVQHSMGINSELAGGLYNGGQLRFRECQLYFPGEADPGDIVNDAAAQTVFFSCQVNGGAVPAARCSGPIGSLNSDGSGFWVS